MELPIFPLNGAVLFPETNLPLNVFEDRYIEMINYSLSKNRFIGMIQLDNNKNLYNIGCVGKIHSFNETDDGRYLISLHGTNCFKVIKEIKNNYSFRMIDAEIIENEKNSDLFNDQQKIDLLKKYENYIKLKNINLNLEDLDKIDLSQIIKFITMISPFKNEEKQSLLESSDLLEFYNKLISVIELELVSDLTNKSIN